MKSFTLAVAVVCMAASVFAATDAERIEALEKKVAELSRKVSVEAPLSVREAYTWHRARLMGLEGAVRHYVLKAEQKNRREIFEKRKAELTKEELAKVEAEERQRAAEERLSDELRKIRNAGANTRIIARPKASN